MDGAITVLALVAIQVVAPPSPSPEDPSGSESSDVESGSTANESTGAASTEPTTDDVAPLPLSREEAERQIVQSCEAALGAGECSASPEDAPYLATVGFTASDVEVTLSGTETPITRHLPFSPADGTDQRLVAAGLLVAAMTASAELSKKSAEVPPPTEPMTPVDSPKRDEPPERPGAALVTLDLGATGALLGGFELPALGGTWGGTHWFHRRVGWTLGASALHSLSGEARVRTVTGTWGSAVRLVDPKSAVAPLLRFGGLLEGVWVDQVTELPDVQSALRGGGYVGVALSGSHRKGTAPVVPFAELSLCALGPAIDVVSGGEEVAELPVLRAGLSAGISWKIY